MTLSPTPGMGILFDDEGVVVRLALLERDEAIAPRDAAGGIGSLLPAPGLAVPSVADGFFGRARVFDGASGLQAVDVGNSTFLPRSVSIMAVVDWDRAGQESSGHPGMLLSRGDASSAAQYRMFGLTFSVSGLSNVGIQLEWQDASGAIVAPASGMYAYRPGWQLVTAVREFVGPDRVLVRFFHGVDLVGESEVIAPDIGRVGGGLTSEPTFILGAAGDGLGGFERQFVGRCDQVVVFDRALQAAEVRLLAQQLTERQALFSALFRGNMPPRRGRAGAIRFGQGDLSTRIGAMSAQLVGLAEQSADRVERAALPSSATGQFLRSWERALRQPFADLLSIEERQARASAALRGDLDMTDTGMRLGVADLLGVDPVELEVITLTNLVEEQFAQLPDEGTWRQVGVPGALAAGGGEMQISLSVGDVLTVGAVSDGATGLRGALSSDEGSIVLVEVRQIGVEADIGILFYAGPDLVQLAVHELGGPRVRFRVRRNAAVGAWQDFGPVTLPVWVRGVIRRDDSSRTVSLSVSSSGPLDGFSDVGEEVFARAIDWVTCGVTDDSPLGLSADMVFRAGPVQLWTPAGHRPFFTYLFRDPAIGGPFNLLAANSQLQRQRAARDAAGCGTKRFLEAGDPDHGCAQVPMIGGASPAFDPVAVLEDATGLIADYALHGKLLAQKTGDLWVASPPILVDVWGDVALASGNGLTGHSFDTADGAVGYVGAPGTDISELDNSRSHLLIVAFRTIFGAPPAARCLFGKRLMGGGDNGWEIVLQANGEGLFAVDDGATSATSGGGTMLGDDQVHVVGALFDVAAGEIVFGTESSISAPAAIPGDCSAAVVAAVGACRNLAAGVKTYFVADVSGPQVEGLALQHSLAAIHDRLT